MFTKVAHRLGNVQFLIAFSGALILALPIGMWIGSSIRPHQRIPLSADRKMPSFEDVMLFQAEHIGDISYDLVLKNQMDKKPVFAIVRDESGGEYVVVISETGELSVRSVKSFLECKPFSDGIFAQ